MTAYTLIADVTEPPAKGAAEQQNPFAFGGPFFLMAMFGLVAVFLFILPARRKQKEQDQMLAKLKPGAKVVLGSGIIGTVVKVQDDGEVTLRSEDAKLRVLRSAIVSVRGEESATDAKS
ncbi:preprotein translocase subunit YajC [Fimbriiglobus ruber]|uniref:Sec translocon accessory complex subunit YajC n=1 Tax=Fimbriiglobus ruber TaxID=1908690 RepID=A0A225E7D0_9BACT|nr:preprotein translocase subunit YajC [Fimbriiglobus ruber]OWK45419.1 hypothetical protein FRUB_01750 [Fimbriiglobus ruber]